MSVCFSMEVGLRCIQCTSACVFLTDLGQKKSRKRSRWSCETPDQKTIIPGMPTVIPPGLTRDQERAYIGKLKCINMLCSDEHFKLHCVRF